MREGWEVKTLGELCDVLDNKRKPITKKDRVAGDYPYYGATGILDYVESYIFDETLVLIGEDGAKWGAGENTAFAVDGEYWVNNHAHVIRPHRDQILDQWIIYYLNGKDLSEFITGLTVPKLNQGKMRGIPIPFPPLAEQKRIVAVLDEAFAGIKAAAEAARKNLASARELFETTLNATFTQKGEGWVETTLGEAGKITSSKRIYKNEYETSGVPFYRTKEIKELANGKGISLELFISDDRYNEIKTKFGVPIAGDILMTAIGTIGEIYVVRPQHNPLLHHIKDVNPFGGCNWAA